jgi:hypothetical protein
MKSLFKPLLWLALALAGTAQADDSLRCNSALISTNDSKATVLRKCGDPTGRSSLGFIDKPGQNGQYAQIPAEQWTYGPTYGMYHYLRFEGDQLTTITSERN